MQRIRKNRSAQSKFLGNLPDIGTNEFPNNVAVARQQIDKAEKKKTLCVFINKGIATVVKAVNTVTTFPKQKRMETSRSAGPENRRAKKRARFVVTLEFMALAILQILPCGEDPGPAGEAGGNEEEGFEEEDDGLLPAPEGQGKGKGKKAPLSCCVPRLKVAAACCIPRRSGPVLFAGPST